MSEPRCHVLHFIDSGGVYGAERVILNLSSKMLAAPEIIPLVGCIVPKPDSPSDLFDVARSAGIEAIKIPNADYHTTEQHPCQSVIS